MVLQCLTRNPQGYPILAKNNEPPAGSFGRRKAMIWGWGKRAAWELLDGALQPLQPKIPDKHLFVTQIVRVGSQNESKLYTSTVSQKPREGF